MASCGKEDSTTGTSECGGNDYPIAPHDDPRDSDYEDIDYKKTKKRSSGQTARAATRRRPKVSAKATTVTKRKRMGPQKVQEDNAGGINHTTNDSAQEEDDLWLDYDPEIKEEELSEIADGDVESDSENRPSKSPKLNKNGTPRKTRGPRPRLTNWGAPEIWPLVVIGIVKACGEKPMLDIPFGAAAGVISPNVTRQALQQAILKLRDQLVADGLIDRDGWGKLSMKWHKKGQQEIPRESHLRPRNPKAKQADSSKAQPSEAQVSDNADTNIIELTPKAKAQSEESMWKVTAPSEKPKQNVVTPTEKPKRNVVTLSGRPMQKATISSEKRKTKPNTPSEKPMRKAITQPEKTIDCPSLVVTLPRAYDKWSRKHLPMPYHILPDLQSNATDQASAAQRSNNIAIGIPVGMHTQGSSETPKEDNHITRNLNDSLLDFGLLPRQANNWRAQSIGNPNYGALDSDNFAPGMDVQFQSQKLHKTNTSMTYSDGSPRSTSRTTANTFQGVPEPGFHPMNPSLGDFAFGVRTPPKVNDISEFSFGVMDQAHSTPSFAFATLNQPGNSFGMHSSPTNGFNGTSMPTLEVMYPFNGTPGPAVNHTNQFNGAPESALIPQCRANSIDAFTASFSHEPAEVNVGPINQANFRGSSAANNVPHFLGFPDPNVGYTDRFDGGPEVNTGSCFAGDAFGTVAFAAHSMDTQPANQFGGGPEANTGYRFTNDALGAVDFGAHSGGTHAMTQFGGGPGAARTHVPGGPSAAVGFGIRSDSPMISSSGVMTPSTSSGGGATPKSSAQGGSDKHYSPVPVTPIKTATANMNIDEGLNESFQGQGNDTFVQGEFGSFLAALGVNSDAGLDSRFEVNYDFQKDDVFK